MDTSTARRPLFLDPIEPDWTIRDLIEWLGEDSRQHDAALRYPLAVIEAALTGSRWSGAPSTVALVRSIAGAVRVAPALGTIRIGSLARSTHTEPSAPAADASLGRVRSDRPESRIPADAGAHSRSTRVLQRDDRSAQAV
ncbi:MAG: hypothetical protein WAK00_09125 [Microbacterium sp.]|uniref:hypothetical protein n=1 Tax=Microbacterium sp. TaxID=51671 RepID=UPI003BAF549F